VFKPSRRIAPDYVPFLAFVISVISLGFWLAGTLSTRGLIIQIFVFCAIEWVVFACYCWLFQSRHRLNPEFDTSKSVRSVFSVLRLFSYLIPRATRERVFEPAFNDALKDFVETQQHLPDAFKRRWLTTCFLFQGLLIVVDCLRALVLDRLLWLIPTQFRHWWSKPGGS
jgi:hypothetical protein